jgi:putative ABC transport system ATP-binding protein
MTDRPATTGQQQAFAAAPHSTTLAMQNVTKSLPLGGQRVTILRGITLDILPAELVAIVGPSGSGKSTLLGIIAGLDSPSQGQVLVDGTDITRMSETRLAALRNTKIGMVFQFFNLIPMLTAQENVEVPLYVGRRFKHPQQRAQEMLELVGLGPRLHNKPNQLSGGEQQRVAIARALAPQPAIVVMDEPTGNLDRANGDKLLALIRDLRNTTGVTFVIATHDPTIAAAADRSIQIIDGQLAG